MFTCIFFKSFFHVLLAPKRTKRPVTGKISHNSLLLTSRKRHPSVGCCLPPNPFILFLGGAELLQLATRQGERLTSSQTVLPLVPKTEWDLFVILMVTVFLWYYHCAYQSTNSTSMIGQQWNDSNVTELLSKENIPHYYCGNYSCKVGKQAAGECVACLLYSHAAEIDGKYVECSVCSTLEDTCETSGK